MRLSTKAPADACSDADRQANVVNTTGFTRLYPVACGWRTFLAIGIRTVREQCLQKCVTAHRNEIQQIFDESVLVLVRHPCNMVHDITSIMFDQELRPASLKVRVGSKSRSSLYETVISCHRICMRSCCGIVQSSEDPGGATFLNEVADDLVVEIFNFGPLDPLANIFLLLGLESQLDENLL